jgi:hypothetical protein
MGEIARLISKGLMQDWAMVLELAVKEVLPK